MKPYAVALAVVLMLPAAAYSACGPLSYYAPADHAQARALARPHAEFTAFLARARSGDAASQRSLAVLYDIGHLVDRCESEALRWYRRAATGGDPIAKKWMEEHDALARMRAGPECMGRSCPFARGEGARFVELYVEANGSFTVPVTVGGVTVKAIVDTGATFVSMSARHAREMKVNYATGEPMTMLTANGTKQGFRITLPSVEAGGIILENVSASVSEGEMPFLLGMSFLRRLNVTINQGRMTLAVP